MAETARDRRGLGRGLAALLGAGEGESAGVAAGYAELPLDLVEPNPDQPRARIDPDALEALAASIRSSGVLQPLVVGPPGAGGVHQLIAGERRWRAARLAGLARVPAVVRPVAGHERLELALAENLVREDLTPIETAQACACLIEDFGQSHAELAGRLGRSRPAISNLVRLLELPEAVQEMISRGDLTEGHGRAVLMADGPARRLRVAERAVARGLTVRATEDLARSEAADRPRRRPRPEPTALEDAALEGFGVAFDTARPRALDRRRRGRGGAALRRRGRPRGGAGAAGVAVGRSPGAGAAARRSPQPRTGDATTRPAPPRRQDGSGSLFRRRLLDGSPARHPSRRRHACGPSIRSAGPLRASDRPHRPHRRGRGGLSRRRLHRRDPAAGSRP